MRLWTTAVRPQIDTGACAVPALHAMVVAVDERIDRYLQRHGGVGSREALAEVVGRHRLDNEIKTGALVGVFPRTYARPWDADLPDLLLRAALVSVGGDVALSHLTR